MVLHINRSSKVQHALDTVATEIIDNTLKPGDTFTLHDLCERFSISRTIARETMRTLEIHNMVVSSRRVGIKVIDRKNWAVYSPEVIRWRLAVPSEREAQLWSLTALRSAVEPSAAASMAIKGREDLKARLLELASTLRLLGENARGNTREFLEADLEFHRILLTESGNDLFAALAPSVAEVLSARVDFGRQPITPKEEILLNHEAIARAVKDGDAATAETHSRTLLTEVSRALFADPFDTPNK